MTERRTKIYYLTESGMNDLRSSRPFMALTTDNQQTLEEYLPDILGGMNRVDAKVVRARLDKLDGILGSAVKDELRRAIEGILIEETIPSVPCKSTP